MPAAGGLRGLACLDGTCRPLMSRSDVLPGRRQLRDLGYQRHRADDETYAGRSGYRGDKEPDIAAGALPQLRGRPGGRGVPGAAARRPVRDLVRHADPQ